MNINLNPRRRVTFVLTAVAVIGIAIGTVAGIPAIASIMEGASPQPTEATDPVAHTLTADEMTELLQTATFAGTDVAPTDDENVALTLEDGHVVVTETTDADGATVAEHLGYRAPALMAAIAAAEDGADGAATDLTYIVIGTDGGTRGAVTVSPNSPATDAVNDNKPVSTGDTITGSDGWILDEDVTEGAGLDANHASGGKTPTLPDGTEITLPETPAEEPTTDTDQSATSEPSSNANTNGNQNAPSSNASSGGSQTTGTQTGSNSGTSSNSNSTGSTAPAPPAPKPAPKPAPHVHTWTNSWVVPTYGDGPNVEILVRNDYYHSCPCGYSECYDSRTY